MLLGVQFGGQHIDEETSRMVLEERLHLAYGNGTYLLHVAILFSLQKTARPSPPQ